jgi:hypothetical protein
MAAYTSEGRLGKLLGRGRAIVDSVFARDPYRPVILNVLFWCALLVTYHLSG